MSSLLEANIKKEISDKEIEAFRAKTRKLSNRGRFKEVYHLARKYSSRYPHVLQFAYTEAVYIAEDTTGLSAKEVDRRYSMAAKKLRRLIPKTRNAPTRMKRAVRNEYYWFSRQPYKQYRLGLKFGREGYYSAGVGSAQLARAYGNQGKINLARKWAKISEGFWRRFFREVDSKWFNSYMFYAMVLGYQGRTQEMEKAIEKSARIAGKTKNWAPMRELRADIDQTLAKLFN